VITAHKNFRNTRKALALLRSDAERTRHQSFLRKEVLLLLKDLLRTPDVSIYFYAAVVGGTVEIAQDFVHHINRMTLSINLTMIYGIPVYPSDGAVVRAFDEYIRSWSVYLHNSTIRPLDFFPSLRAWPDWMPWNVDVNGMKALKLKWSEDIYNQLEESVINGDADELKSKSFINVVRNRREELGFEKKEDIV
jgi:hypothetical protein